MIPSFHEILSILNSIDGDGAIPELQTVSASLAKRANVRLKALEDAGLTASPAYYRATWWTGKERSRRRFSESKKLTGDDLENQIREMITFLSSDTSSVSFERERQAGLEKILPEGTGKERRQMLRFLESKAFEEMKKTIGTDIVKKAADAIEAGAKVSDLNKLFKEFQRQEAEGTLTVNEDIYTQVWSIWVGE